MRNRKQQDQNLRITYAMVPQAKLLIYYVRRRNGEVVADAITFPIEDIFDNEVSIKFNTRRANPGEEVQVELTADPYSLVNVLAVDKSVLLLKSGNDITTQDVLNELQEDRSTGQFDGTDGKDAFSIFNGAGVYVLTDALLYQYIPQARSESLGYSVGEPYLAGGGGRNGVGSGHGDGSGNGDGNGNGNGDGSGNGSGGENKHGTRTRKNFPETWIWVNRTTGSDGKATINTTAPDTITEWIASAFAVNPRSGLGVAANTANVINLSYEFTIKLNYEL
ncbi:CD109 antigen-like [Mytilus trossulus]|uniref:CD109 antigen-like n=1 Tax=Mytilus trossulus TaxID=6551 RepID=UPI003006CA0B